MRTLRIAAPSQPTLEGLEDPAAPDGGRVWSALPDRAREQTLMMLARLIARGVVVVEGDSDGSEVEA
jgi:hypothetical protein